MKRVIKKSLLILLVCYFSLGFISSTEILGCESISSSGNYILQNNIDNYAGTCFNITVDNVILDGNGKYIEGDASGIYYGIYAEGRTNITIKNFKNITMFGQGFPGFNGALIYLKNTNSSLIQNLSVSLPWEGIILESSFNNLLTNITSNGNVDGIYLTTSSNNNLTNIITNSNQYGIRLISSTNNILTNITATSNNFGGIGLSNSNNNNLMSIIANLNSPYAIYLGNSNNNTLINAELLNNALTILDDGLNNNSFFYYNSFGQIRWTKENLTTNNNLTWPGNVQISNNYAYYNPSGALSIDRLNTSANVSLYETGIYYPTILKDGVACVDCVLLSSSGTNHTFNVTSFSNYTLAENGEAVLPIVTLSSPASALSTITTSQVFQFNTTDASAIANCSLIIDGVVNETNTSVVNATLTSFSKTLAVGSYTWNVNCTDSWGNENSSEIRTLTIAAASTETTTSGGGSSGITLNESCENKIFCSGWDECSDGIQSRECETIYPLCEAKFPELEQVCNEDCVWESCEAVYGFSDVVLENPDVRGIQKGVCNEEEIQRECSLKINIKTDLGNFCNKTTLNIYSMNNVLLSRVSSFNTEISNKKGVDVLFLATLYGGNCLEDRKNIYVLGINEIQDFFNWLPIAIWTSWILLLLFVVREVYLDKEFFLDVYRKVDLFFSEE